MRGAHQHGKLTAGQMHSAQMHTPAHRVCQHAQDVGMPKRTIQNTQPQCHPMAHINHRQPYCQAQGTGGSHHHADTAISRRDALLSTTVSTGLTLLPPPPAAAMQPDTPPAADSGSGTLDPETRSKIRRARRPLPPVRKVVLQPPQLPKKRRGRAAALAPGSPIRVSQIIKGCWQLDGAHRGDAATDRTSGGVALQDFEAFINAGITALDTSDVWGPSESIIGNFLRLHPWYRDQVQLVTHVTVGAEDLERLSADWVAYRVRASMARMGSTSLDLVMLQWEEGLGTKGPAPRKAGLTDTALWLSELQSAGLVRAVGVANMDTPHVLELLDAGVPVSVNQVQYSVLDRRPQLFLQHAAPQRGVQMLATGVLSGGWLSERWLGQPASKAALDTLSKAKAGAWLKEAGGWAWLQEVLEALKTVAERHKTTISAVAIAWVLQQQGVAAACVGARNASHVRDLQAAALLQLDEEDVLVIDAAYEGCPRPPTSDVFVWERGGAW